MNFNWMWGVLYCWLMLLLSALPIFHMWKNHHHPSKQPHCMCDILTNSLQTSSTTFGHLWTCQRGYGPQRQRLRTAWIWAVHEYAHSSSIATTATLVTGPMRVTWFWLHPFNVQHYALLHIRCIPESYSPYCT
jgi:hypothetical protein